MFTKLAFRNVKRQIGNYLLYFITVSLTVALMFAVNNIIYSSELTALSDSSSNLSGVLTGITILVALIAAFVLGYATSFMLRLRRREFGTYLILGMTRTKILQIFTIETMILCLFALAVGTAIGVFAYQGLMAMVSGILETDYAFSNYSAKGMTLTAILVVSMFALDTLVSGLFLRRASIHSLVSSAPKSNRKVRFPIVHFIIAILSFAAIVFCGVRIFDMLNLAIRGTLGTDAKLMYLLFALAVSIFIFHMSLSKSIMSVLVKNKRFASVGTRTFTLRQLSSRLTTNAAMAGALALLISFSVICASLSLNEKLSARANLEKNYPFDIVSRYDTSFEHEISPEDGKEIIEKYAGITGETSYNVYTNGLNTVTRHTPWGADSDYAPVDAYIKVSDINKLLSKIGEDEISLDGGYKVLAYEQLALDGDYSEAVLSLNGNDYEFMGITMDMKSFTYDEFLIVVPDEAVEGMKIAYEYTAYDLDGSAFDALKMNSDLEYKVLMSSAYPNDPDAVSGYYMTACDYDIREYAKIRMYADSAVAMISTMYMSIAFVLMAMAMLGLKTLSDISEDKRRFETLRTLGVNKAQRARTLFMQTFWFFMIPFIMPVLMSIPSGMFGALIMRAEGYSDMIHVCYQNTIITAFVIIILYALFFMATYVVAKRNVVTD